VGVSRLREELAIIPRNGVILAVAIVGLVATLVLLLPREPLGVRVAFAGVAGIFLFTFVLLVSYVYSDAKRRGMRHVVWTLVVVFVPNAIGFIIYFLVRDPPLKPCGSCGTPARREFAFCPQCGSGLPRVCRSCSRPVEPAWPHCAHCGIRLLTEEEGPRVRSGSTAAPS
jgi:hypothetical protein